MSEITDTTQEMRNVMNDLIKALGAKTQTILRQQQQLDVCFQCINTICDLAAAGRFDDLVDLANMYKERTVLLSATKVQ